MSMPVSPQLTDPDDSRDPVADLRDAMAAVNPLERVLFGRLIRRFIRSPKLGWVSAVNAVGLASATRALVAARWSTITFVSALVACGFLIQHSVAARSIGIAAAIVFVVAFVSYLARMGETWRALGACRSRRARRRRG
jgi:hypothetical protein